MGKTTLIRKALEETEGIKVLYTALPIDLEGNAKALGDALLKAIGIHSLRAETIDELFSFLNTRSEQITIAIYEYQDMKKRKRKTSFSYQGRICIVFNEKCLLFAHSWRK